MAWLLAIEQNSCYTKVKNKPNPNTHIKNDEAQVIARQGNTTEKKSDRDYSRSRLLSWMGARKIHCLSRASLSLHSEPIPIKPV